MKTQLVLLLVCLTTVCFSQSKKEQIAQQQLTIDSLIAVLSSERANFEVNTKQFGEQISTLEGKIKDHLATINSLQDSIRLKKTELTRETGKLNETQTELERTILEMQAHRDSINRLNSELSSSKKLQLQLEIDLNSCKENLHKQLETEQQESQKSNLIADLSKIAPPEEYKIVGPIRMGELTYKEFFMGDVGHYYFTDSQKKELEFGGNLTDIALIIETPTADSEYSDYITNPLYANKKFLVYWRHLVLQRKPQDSIEDFYKEYDEIIYLEIK
jgi:hypothetical protein